MVCKSSLVTTMFVSVSFTANVPERSFSIAFWGRTLATTCRDNIQTFEHDKYNDGDSVQNESRQYLQDRGYILIADDISVDDQHPFEDWWAHPDLVDGNIIAAMKCVTGETKKAEDYMLGKV